MKKSGMVYRYIAERVLADRKAKLVVREIARELGISPNTVSLAIAPLQRSGAAAMYLRHFEVTDLSKLLSFWAVTRKLSRDVIYSTYVEMKAASEVEERMPDGIAYTCCSGYTAMFGNDVSDYSSVYVYAPEYQAREIMGRFPAMEMSKRAAGHNLFVLKPDPALKIAITEGGLAHSTAPLTQLYVDLWGSGEWYSYEFMIRLRKRIGDMYGKAILE